MKNIKAPTFLNMVVFSNQLMIGNVWYHGDYVLVNSKTGGVHMLGRSDGTLNPSGVRFGSSELYNIVGNFPTIEDSLAVCSLNNNSLGRTKNWG